MRDYREKTVVITGAASGIGAALAHQFARRGALLALSDIDDDGLDHTANRCRASGATVERTRLDVADRDAVNTYAEHVVERFGTVHTLINNAGVAAHGPFTEHVDSDLHWIMDINFWGVVHGTRAFLPYLKASGDGQIANISSIFGLVATPRSTAYVASKFAVRGFTEALRQELRLDRVPVTVSCVHPGGIKTNIARSARTSADDAAAIQRLFDRVAFTSSEQAARTIISGLSRDRARILVGPDAWLIAALPRLLGARYHHAVETGARLLGV